MGVNVLLIADLTEQNDVLCRVVFPGCMLAGAHVYGGDGGGLKSYLQYFLQGFIPYASRRSWRKDSGVSL
jgi:hypothetical protein